MLKLNRIRNETKVIRIRLVTVLPRTPTRCLLACLQRGGAVDLTWSSSASPLGQPHFYSGPPMHFYSGVDNVPLLIIPLRTKEAITSQEGKLSVTIPFAHVFAEEHELPALGAERASS